MRCEVLFFSVLELIKCVFETERFTVVLKNCEMKGFHRDVHLLDFMCSHGYDVELMPSLLK